MGVTHTRHFILLKLRKRAIPAGAGQIRHSFVSLPSYILSSRQNLTGGDHLAVGSGRRRLLHVRGDGNRLHNSFRLATGRATPCIYKTSVNTNIYK